MAKSSTKSSSLVQRTKSTAQKITTAPEPRAPGLPSPAEDLVPVHDRGPTRGFQFAMGLWFIGFCVMVLCELISAIWRG